MTGCMKNFKDVARACGGAKGMNVMRVFNSVDAAKYSALFSLKTVLLF
jgi:hypothetical protein